VEDPITIIDGSGGDLLSKDARTTDKEVEASPVVKRTHWPIRLHSVEERRKKKEEEREGEEKEEKEEEQSHLQGRLSQEAHAQRLQQEQRQQLQEEQP